MTALSAKLILQATILRCEDALQLPNPGDALRAAVRDAFVALGTTKADEVFEMLRAIEFEADRVEVHGTNGVKEQLAHARAALK